MIRNVFLAVKDKNILRMQNKIKQRMYRLGTLLGLTVLLFGIFASAQEKACNLSRLGSQIHFVAQAEQGHSEHCIRHQKPLPEGERVRSSNFDLGSLISASIFKSNFVGLANSYVKNPIPNQLPFSGNGIPLYKQLAHFLI